MIAVRPPFSTLDTIETIRERERETDSVTRIDIDGQGEVNEKHKQDQLAKQKEGKGHWKPELASNSEEAVAADRQAGDQSIEELQKKTAEHAEKKHK